ncbi:MAG: hypothetical protein LUI05_04135, partial [Oscillospiraceae bacterium]|nr:hypothetical protein [Oscillospiraceae bacterium]
MKVKTIRVVLAAILMTFSFSSCAESTTEDAVATKTNLNAEASSEGAETAADTVNAEAGETYEGTVVAVDKTSVTVESDGSNVLIPISDDTEFVREMGGDSPRGDIENSDGTPPEKPDGDMDTDSNGTPPEMPDGDMGDMDNGSGEKPGGSMGDMERGSGEKPDGNNGGMDKDSDGTPPEKPDGDMDTDSNGTPPE